MKEHPDADSLSIVHVGPWVIVVRTEDWESIDKGVYIQPDTLVPNRPPFGFLFDKSFKIKLDDEEVRVFGRDTEEIIQQFARKKIYLSEDQIKIVGSNPRYRLLSDGTAEKDDEGPYARVTVRKFRGVHSFGLLVPAPAKFNLGDDAAEYFGLKHYEATVAVQGGEDERGPIGVSIPVYDVDVFKNYEGVLKVGEQVSISEKIHGTNARFFFGTDTQGNRRMFCGSHTNWKKDDKKSGWWKALRSHPEIAEFCEAHPDIVVYGEVYGQQIQKGFTYGQETGNVGILVFDLYRIPTDDDLSGGWVDVSEARELGKNLPWVPLVAHDVPFDPEAILEMAEGTSSLDDHVIEGVVVRPMEERYDTELGRVVLKVVGFGYYEGKSKKKNKKRKKDKN